VEFGRRCGCGRTKPDVAEADRAINHVAGHDPSAAEDEACVLKAVDDCRLL
jgi:hypothetical protein